MVKFFKMLCCKQNIMLTYSAFYRSGLFESEPIKDASEFVGINYVYLVRIL